jgi:hypothetical protein
MTKKELKKELKRLKNRLKKELSVGKYYEAMVKDKRSLLLDANLDKKKLEYELVNVEKMNANTLNDFSDVFNDNYSRMNVFAEVQNVCIKSMGTDLEENNRAEHYAWFFSYIHDLLKNEANREFKEVKEQFEKQFEI